MERRYRLREYVDGNGASVWRIQSRPAWWPFWHNEYFFGTPWSYCYYEFRDHKEGIEEMLKMIHGRAEYQRSVKRRAI